MFRVYNKAHSKTDKPFAIEFFLPLELLSLDPKALAIPDKDDPAIPVKFSPSTPIFLRWRHRAMKNNPVGNGYLTWQCLTQKLKTGIGTNLLNSDPFWVPQDFSHTTLKDLIEHEGCSCLLGFLFCPTPSKQVMPHSLLTAALKGGSPFAFWYREKINIPNQLQTNIENLIRASTFSEIPHKLYFHREQDSENQNSPINRPLIVFWDDAQRNPLNKQFSHPTQ